MDTRTLRALQNVQWSSNPSLPPNRTFGPIFSGERFSYRKAFIKQLPLQPQGTFISAFASRRVFASRNAVKAPWWNQNTAELNGLLWTPSRRSIVDQPIAGLQDTWFSARQVHNNASFPHQLQSKYLAACKHSLGTAAVTRTMKLLIRRTLHKKQLRGHKGVVSYVESTSDTKKHVQEALDKELEEDGYFIDHPKKPENANFVIATGWVTGRLDGRVINPLIEQAGNSQTSKGAVVMKYDPHSRCTDGELDAGACHNPRSLPTYNLQVRDDLKQSSKRQVNPVIQDLKKHVLKCNGYQCSRESAR